MEALSDRGYELLIDGEGRFPLIAVEDCVKWYSLYVVFSDGNAEVLEYDGKLERFFIDEYDETAVGDHVFNPRFVLYLGRCLNMEVAEQSLEALIGRWELEYLNTDFTRPKDCIRRDCVFRTNGSRAVPGFLNPEGVVVYHLAGNVGFKKTLDKDALPKTLKKQ